MAYFKPGMRLESITAFIMEQSEYETDFLAGLRVNLTDGNKQKDAAQKVALSIIGEDIDADWEELLFTSERD
jgi:hypothetical protein